MWAFGILASDKWCFSYGTNCPLPRRVGNWVEFSTAKALGIVWKDRTSKNGKQKRRITTIVAVCVVGRYTAIVLLRYICLSLLESKRSQAPLRYWFGPNVPLVLVRANCKTCKRLLNLHRETDWRDSVIASIWSYLRRASTTSAARVVKPFNLAGSYSSPSPPCCCMTMIVSADSPSGQSASLPFKSKVSASSWGSSFTWTWDCDSWLLRNHREKNKTGELTPAPV